MEDTKTILDGILYQIDIDIQEVRPIVMTYPNLDRNWERALQKYDELAIRKDQTLRIIKALGF